MYSSKGFTLIEMLVTLAVLALLLGLAVPSYRTFVLDNRTTSQANDLLASLQLARSEAIKRGVRVTVCKSGDGATCTSFEGWEQGWLTFVDSDGDGQRDTTPAPGERILQVREALSDSGQTLSGGAGLANYISYRPRGDARLADGTPQSGVLVVCDGSEHGDQARVLRIARNGRAEVAKASSAEAAGC